MDLAYIDKNALRQRLPLAHVAAELGILLDESGSGLCPFHDDTSPSFNIWLDDQGIERWGCFPCGLSGDVYDLLRRIEGLTFPEALNRAEQIAAGLPKEYTPRQRTPKATWDQRAAEQLVADAATRALGNDGWLCVVTGLVSEHMDVDYRRSADRFLRESWRWGVDSSGNIVMPHYDAMNQLTGVKMRALDGHKWSFPGSRYGALYGSWRRRQSRYVLITEGEGDAVYASLQSPPADVIALPSGAGLFQPEWAALEADIYFLAFDADAAGQDATQTWLEALTGDVRVCRLPRGHDLKSSRPSIIDMMRHAVKPSEPIGGLDNTGTRFERQTANGPRVLTSWCCEPTARLESRDELVFPAIEVAVKANGQEWTDVITMNDLHSASKFRTWAGKRSLDCMLNDSDLQLLTNYLMARSTALPEVFQTARIGSHAAPERYRYAGRTIVAPGSSIGRLPWRYVGPSEAEGNVLLDDDGPVSWDWLTSFLSLNEPSVTHPLLAWLIASTRRDEFQQFPMMFLGGSSGSGKTTTARLATQLVGSRLSVSLASITQFALIRTLALTTTVPLFVDEWSLQSRQDARETVQSIVPIVYDGGVTTRGRADLTVAEFRLTAPVLMAGEDSFHLDREADRMVALRLRRDAQNHKQLQHLISEPVHRFAYWFNRWLVEAPSLPPIPGPGMTRPVYNRACLEVGWETLARYLDWNRESSAEPIPMLPEMDVTQLVKRDDDRENEYEAFLNEGMSLRDADGLPLVWTDARGTWVRFRMLASNRNLSGVDVELPGRSRAMKQYFADRYEMIDERVIPPYGERPVRATLIVGWPEDIVPPAVNSS